MEESRVLASLTRVLVLGVDLRQRLEVVARREGLDGVALGRRIIEAAVSARERTEAAGEPEHE